MSRFLHLLLMGAALAMAGCATNQPPQAEQAQGPIGWGDAVNGLQVGIGAQLTQNAPGQPQTGAGYLNGVVVYLKNFGTTPLTIIDPKPITTGGAAKGFLWSVYTEPDHTAQVETLRMDPARVLTLTPGQSTSFSVPLPMLPRGQGAHRLVAAYDNDDAVINIASGASSKSASGIWIGHAKSPELFVNDAP